MSQDSVEDLLNDEDDLEDDYNLDNDEEEKLLQDDGTDIGDNEVSENELDESEDVLNLEVEEELEEDDIEGRRSNKSSERLNINKFTNERPPISPVQFNDRRNEDEKNKGKKSNHQNISSFQCNRTKGRFNRQQKWKTRNKTVHINPHFKGDVQINGNARLKWDSPQNQKHINNQGRNLNNFKQTARVEVWQNQPQKILPVRRFNPSQYMNPSSRVQPAAQVMQHYTQHQMPQMISSTAMSTVPYNQHSPQLYQNREVFVRQAPVTVGFFQPPPQPQVVSQQCYQTPIGPPNFCNNPVYNQPPPYNNAPQCFSYNNQPMVYNTPPPTQNDYCQTYSMHPVPPPSSLQPPPVNYCNSFENNTSSITNSYERVVLPRSAPGFNDDRKVVKSVYSGKLQKKRFTNKNFDSNVHSKKKRMIDCKNLHEIKPIENVTSPKATESKSKDESTVKLVDLPEGLDEEYMRKIEEQKRLREEIFKRKELKRMEKAAGVAPTENNKISSPVKKVITKTNTHFVKRQNIINNQKNRNQNRNLVLINQQTSDEPPNIKIEVPAQNTSRVIQLKKEEDDVGLTKGFLSNRMVLTNDHSLLNTPIVVVKNLSAGTTENKLQKMCQGIGEVQTLHLSREERQATIHFKSVASAHAFYKKYQRYMLDLSMIQVHLQTV